MHSTEPIHVTVAASDHDPRIPTDDPPGVVVHRVPALHPDDLDVVHGIPITSVSRTLVDLAECMDQDELRDTFARAAQMGLLDMDEVHASRSRVEWRASLIMLDAVIAEFDASYDS